MIEWLGLFLASGAVAMCVSGVVSLAAGVAAAFASRVHATARADLLVAVAIAPALAVVATVAAVVGPSVLDVLGWRPDHCVLHDHHSHLCAVHGELPPAWLAGLGAVAWATLAVRLLGTTLSQVRSSRALTALARLGRPSLDDPSRIEVPGSPWVCVATGVVHRRVVVSSSLREELTPACWRAALAHEQAHLERHDPLVGLLLSIALVAAWPLSARLLGRWREASELAADAHAARDTTPAAVAEALVAVARLAPSQVLRPALAADALQRRVLALLDRVHPAGVARPGFAACVSVSASLLLVLGGSDAAHHTFESLLATFR